MEEGTCDFDQSSSINDEACDASNAHFVSIVIPSCSRK